MSSGPVFLGSSPAPGNPSFIRPGIGIFAGTVLSQVTPLRRSRSPVIRSHLVPRPVIALFIIILVLLVIVLVVTIAMPFRMVISAVWPVIYYCNRNPRRCIIPVPRPGYVSAVIPINITCIMRELPVRVIMQVHSPDAADPSEIVIGDHYISCLDDPTIVVIKDRHLLDLYHGPVIIVLHVGIIVIS